jgi:hypothetical protein
MFCIISEAKDTDALRQSCQSMAVELFQKYSISMNDLDDDVLTMKRYSDDLKERLEEEFSSKKYLETGSELLVVKHFKFFRRTNDIQLLKNCLLQGFDAFPSQPYNSIVQYKHILVNSYIIKINCGMLKIILYL